MSNTRKRRVAVLVGSLRKDALSRKMAKVITVMAANDLTLEIVEIRDLALYDADLEASPPKPWRAFRDQIRGFDAVLFVTPEYNRSIPGALKNAIDVGSRPHGKSVWQGKLAAIVSVSPGKIGGFGANHHLRQTTVFLDMPVLQAPEMYIGGADRLFDAEGNLTSEEVRPLLAQFCAAFVAWIDRNASADPAMEQAS